MNRMSRVTYHALKFLHRGLTFDAAFVILILNIAIFSVWLKWTTMYFLISLLLIVFYLRSPLDIWHATRNMWRKRPVIGLSFNSRVTA